MWALTCLETVHQRHVWRGRLKPGCWIVGSSNNCWWFNHTGILCIHEILFNAIGKLTEQRSTSPIHTDIHPFFSDWTWVIQLPSWIIRNLFTATASCTFSIGELFSHSSISDHYHIFYVTLWCVTDFSYCSALQYSVPDRGAEYCYASVCLSVCVCACLSVHDHIFGTTHPIFTKFLCMILMAMAQSSYGGVVVRYVLPVLWRTSYLTISHGCSTSPPSWSAHAHAALGLAITVCSSATLRTLPSYFGQLLSLEMELQHLLSGGLIAEWLACWTQAQKDPGSNRSRDAVG